MFTDFFVPSPRKGRQPSKEVAIVVPLSSAPELTGDEKISMSQLVHHLGHYDKYLIAPKGSTISEEGFHVLRFSNKFFGSAAAHGKLLQFIEFYRNFEDYQYILFYHLDSLVFSDDLSKWCSRGFDYIGAPWICCADSPWVDRSRVGNGGFALLNVDRAIKVICNRYRKDISSYWLDLLMRHVPPRVIFLLGHLTIFRWKWIQRLIREWHETQNPTLHNRNNDIFWSDHAVNYLPDFKVATVEDGLKFAFEVSPRLCFALNGNQMPFGCHAWTRYDRDFWESQLVEKSTNPANV